TCRNLYPESFYYFKTDFSNILLQQALLDIGAAMYQQAASSDDNIDFDVDVPPTTLLDDNIVQDGVGTEMDEDDLDGLDATITADYEAID
ncbi:MAG: hypothetical protein O3A14_12895, partial [Cyanobacteria bacterium]|nr:hypothetical protein [Cyanobacteriota bacterium]